MSRSGGVLTLDLASRVGWAYAPLDADKPWCGVWALPNCAMDPGRCFAAFENELLDAITVHEPKAVVIEGALATGDTNAIVLLQQIGLAAHAYSACYRREIKIQKIAATTVRSKVYGTARFPKGETKKILTAFVQGKGIVVPDHNAADAVMIWLYEQGVAQGRWKRP